MLRRAQTSLQVKLILAFIALMIIPTAAISAYNLLSVRSALLSRISVEQLRMAEARAAAVESKISEGGADLLAIVRAPAMRRFARYQSAALEDLSATFEAFLSQSAGNYSGICLLNVRGQELLCVRRDGDLFRRVPVSDLAARPDDPAFREALRRSARPYGRPIAIAGTDSGQLHYAVLYPNEHGAPAGVLILEAPLEPILSALVDSEPDVSTFVVDSAGNFLLSDETGAPTLSRWGSLRQVQPNDAMRILGHPAGIIADSPDRPGIFQVFTRLQVPGQGTLSWTVLYARPLDTLVGEVWSTQLVIAVVSAGALVVAIGLAQLLTRELVRPVQALAAAAEQVVADDLGAPIPADGLDEIGALGRSLNRTVARLREALAVAEGRRNEAETLRAATQALGATLERGRVLELILSELRKVVPYDSASVQEIEGDQSTIIGTYGLAWPYELIGTSFSLRVGESPNAEVARTRAPVILDDGPLSYDIFTSAPFRVDPIRSWLGVPMLFGERMIGMITLDKHEPGFYTAEHARLAAAFAAQAATAMENARLYEAAQRELRDRTRAEAAHARLVAIIEATTDLVGMSDMEGRILFLNQAARSTLAIPDDEDLSNMSVAELYSPQLRAWLRDEAVPAAVRDGAWSGETTLRSRDGVEVPVSQVIIAHKGADGMPEFLSTIVRDMRERRRAEEELRQAQKMEALGRLAGGMAHDFNNLLTVILGEADLLLDEVPPHTPVAQSAEQIRQAGMRAAALTRQLLAFSRRQVLQPELIDLSAVVGAMEQMLRRLLGEDITLTIDLAPGLPLVRADPGQIEQVVLNLCINARDAMPAGGRLTIETAEVLLDADYARQHPEVTPGPHAMLAVSDTGAGMDEETQRHIFEPFFTTNARGKGTGLGLATVHGIVRQSGGHIWFSSEQERGSCFKVYLPTVPGEAPQAELEAVEPLPQAAAETVLLVEDDDSVRALTRGILSRQGYEVIEAADGPSALAAAEAHAGAIDLLLTDVVMPGGLNGVQVAAALRERRPAVRVVFMSGYTDNALVEQSLGAAGDRYLQKPFSPAELARALAEVMAAG